MENLGVQTAINIWQWQQFKEECQIKYPGSFWNEHVHIFTPNREAANILWSEKRDRLANAALKFRRKLVQIFWSLSDSDKPIPIKPKPTINQRGNFTMPDQPLITIPSIEIGSLTVTRQLLRKIEWMLENPKPKTGVVRLHDEAQVIMSASSAALLTTTTLREAVTRKRSEFWHPLDLLQFRIRTGELARDLKQGLIRPEDTLQEVQWRCVSRSGNWRLFTVQYETFLDDMGIPYQFSNNQGAEPIERPTDLVFNV